MSSLFLPYGRQVIEDDDVAEVSRVLRSDYLSTGPEVPAFEAAFSKTTEANHAIACSSGTSALHLVALALGLKEGTAAIVPSLTFLATANAVRLTGAEVVFADVDPTTGLMTPSNLQAALERSTLPVRATFVVHLGGQTCDLPAISSIATTAGVVVVEDACHALGTHYRSGDCIQRVGACRHSIACTFSLHPVKTIAAGEGGVVTCNNESLATRITNLRNHGIERDPAHFCNNRLALDPHGQPNAWYYEMSDPGLNYRLSDIHAALAKSQLRKLSRFANIRRNIAEHYDRRIAKLRPHILPVPRVNNCDPVLHLYQVLIDFSAIGIDRSALMLRLREDGIGTQVHYIPVHRQPYYATRYPDTALTGTDNFYAATLSLPLHAAMTIADADRVLESLEQHTKL